MVNIGDITTQDQAVFGPISNRVAISRTVGTAGVQSITGVGFKPRFILAIGCVQNTNTGFISISDGPGAAAGGCLSNKDNTTAGTWQLESYHFYHDTPGGGDFLSYITSYDSDGFSLNWIGTNTSGTLTIYAWCFK